MMTSRNIVLDYNENFEELYRIYEKFAQDEKNVKYEVEYFGGKENPYARAFVITFPEVVKNRRRKSSNLRIVDTKTYIFFEFENVSQANAKKLLKITINFLKEKGNQSKERMEVLMKEFRKI